MLDDDEPLALFHAKFWGKSMAEEERDWRNTQLPISAIGGEFGDEDHGDKRMDEIGDDVMDEGTGTDLDDDIIPGCYMLDIDIDQWEDLPSQRIWIRADYIRIWDELTDHYNTYPSKGRAPAAVLTGQPGIGKSLCRFVRLSLT
jgi:hypothetical protein